MKGWVPVLFLALAAPAWAGERQGVPPRAAVTDYAVSREQPELSIGAYQLSKEQVKNSFATDLERGYIVVEIGVFPGPKGAVELRRSSFVLRVPGTATLLRPASPETIAAVLQKKPDSSGRDIVVHPTVGVGYETGGRDINGQRNGGWTTSTGAAVGIGGGQPAPASTPADRATMKTELQDKILPEGSLTKPSAGYLYFPIASRQKDVAYQLEYRADDTRIVLALPQPKR